jgi:hypothetical protein
MTPELKLLLPNSGNQTYLFGFRLLDILRKRIPLGLGLSEVLLGCGDAIMRRYHPYSHGTHTLVRGSVERNQRHANGTKHRRGEKEPLLDSMER